MIERSGEAIRRQVRLSRCNGPILAVALLLPAASGAQQRPGLSDSARAFLTAALDTLQQASMHRETIDWRVVRDSAFLLADGARRLSDTYGAIDWALQRVDRHSFLQAGRGQVNPELLAGRYGYLRIPFYAGPEKAPLTDSLQNALRTLEEGGACGWIVDLRLNGGGNIWPMQTGIAPLLGDSLIRREIVKGRTVSYTVYDGGATFLVDEAGTRTEITRAEAPYRMRRPLAPVAVLIDQATASSAEGIAIAFRPRANTRFFGQPTAGYSTVNRGSRLADGANMVITVGAMSDRNGRPYGNSLEPDEQVENPAGNWPHSNDVVARRAAGWLASQEACRAR